MILREAAIQWLLMLPTVSPDEAVFADMARTLLTHGNIGLTMWGTSLPGLPEHFFLYPPLLPTILAGWFTLVGSSIVAQRALSAVTAIITLTVLGVLARRVIAPMGLHRVATRMLIATAIALTATDLFFGFATRLGRPEIFILLAHLLTLIAALAALHHTHPHQQDVRACAAGILAAAATLLHPIGITTLVAPAITFGLHGAQRRYRLVAIFLLAAAIPIGVWMLSVVPHWDAFTSHVLLATQRRFVNPWFWDMLQPGSFGNLAATTSAVTTAGALLILLAHIRTHRTPAATLLLVALSTTLAAVVYGRLSWYFVLPVPIAIVALTAVIADRWSPHMPRNPALLRMPRWPSAALLGATVVVLAISIHEHARALRALGDQRLSYTRFTDAILREVPLSATVFLSAIPDPSYAFRARNTTQQLIQAPSLDIGVDNYRALLDASTHVVFNESIEGPYFDDLFATYLDRHVAQTVTIGNHDGYSATIMTLVPPKERRTAVIQ